MKIVFYGLTITSSWGNGHATTYRSLLNSLNKRGHSLHFVEKDVEWYRNNRDLPHPPFCSVHFYDLWQPNKAMLLSISSGADAVVIGSYFPDAVAATRALFEQVRCPVLFYDIDTPITLRRLRTNEDPVYLDRTLIPGYAAYLSFTGGPALDELEQSFGAKRAVPFYCSVDPDLYYPAAQQDLFRCDLSYLGTYAKDRQPKLMGWLNGAAALMPQKEFLVAGALYPEGTPWESNVRRITHVSPPDHSAFYSSSRFTLNLTRDDMVFAGYSPSVRLFEASACAAAILSDPWPGLEDFLTPGEEILLPDGAAEVVAILEQLSDAERLRMGRRARDRVLAEHTADHRAEEFERVLADCRPC